MDNRERKLFDATAHLDENLVANLTEHSKQNTKRAGRPLWLIPVLASLLVIALIAGSLPFMLLNKEDLNQKGDTDHEIIQPKLPPWETGNLKLTTVVYSPDKIREAGETDVHGKGIQLLSSATDPDDSLYTALLDETEMETETNASDGSSVDVTVSLSPSTKISAFSGSDYIQVQMQEGEHTDCESVWYDVRKDEVICLSCTIREAVSQTPDYLDACIRLAIESGLLSIEDAYSGEIREAYAAWYNHLNRESVLAFFATGKKPSAKALEITDTELYRNGIGKVLNRYSYPTIQVLDFGTNPHYCLYALTNADMTLSYGLFLFDLDSGAATKLDGSHIGDPHDYNGLCYGEGELLPNPAQASEIWASEDYELIVCEVPYVVSHLTYDDSTFTLHPSYLASNTAVYANGGFYCLYDRYGEADPIVSAPVRGLIVKGDTISFIAADGRTGFCVDGGTVFFLTGERLLLTQSKGVPYVWMLQDEVPVCYRLSATGAEPIDAEEAASSISVGERTLMSGHLLQDLATGETTRLFDSEPLASTRTQDGRFAYFYLGDGKVTCVDLDTGARGYLQLGNAFEEQILELEDLTYCLFLNRAENELLLAFYHKGQLTFNREAYIKSFSDHSRPHSLLWIENVETFNSEFSTVFDYYMVDGKPVKVKNASRALKMGRIVFVSVMEQKVDYHMTQAYYKQITSFISTEHFLADVAEALIPYMDFTVNTCQVTAQTLKTALPVSTDVFDQQFGSVGYRMDSEVRMSEERVKTAETQLELEAREIANNLIRRVTGYLSPDCLMRDSLLRTLSQSGSEKTRETAARCLSILDDYYEQFNAQFDKETIEQKRTNLIEVILSLLPEPYLIVDNYGNRYATYQKEFDAFLIDHWDELFSTICDTPYEDFLSSGSFLDAPSIGDFYWGRSASHFGAVFMDSGRHLDKDALKAFLNGLSFAKAEISIVPAAAIYCANNPFLTVGKDSDGNTWMVSYGYAASLTQIQYQAFLKLCDGEIPYDINQMEDATYYEYFQVLEESRRNQ